jgi:hypothetical protein
MQLQPQADYTCSESTHQLLDVSRTFERHLQHLPSSLQQVLLHFITKRPPIHSYNKQLARERNRAIDPRFLYTFPYGCGCRMATGVTPIIRLSILSKPLNITLYKRTENPSPSSM